MHALELKVPPPVVAVLIGAAMWLASRSGPSIDLPPLIRTVGAGAIAASGGILAFAGKIAFRRAKTTINPMRPANASSLVTSGIYRFTRNPMYLGLLLLLLGWSVYLSSVFVFVGPVLLILYLGRFQIAPEERVLAAKFGEAYLDYTSRVRRWL
jgi:protein-S-isoprenylcysteine O-methyltransferase Ste14